MPIVVATLRALLRPEYDLSEAQSTTHSTTPARRRQRPARRSVRHRRRVRRARPGPPRQRLDRSRRAAVPDEHRRRQARRLRHGAARPARQVHDVPDREHRRVAVGAVLGRRRLRPVRLRRDRRSASRRRTRSCSSTTPTTRTRRSASCGSWRRAIANPGSNNAFIRTGSVAVAINPDHAAVLARAGLSRADVQSRAAPAGDQPARRPPRAQPGVRRAGRRRRRAPDVAVAGSRARPRRRWRRAVLVGVPVVVGRRPPQPDPPRAHRDRPGLRAPVRNWRSPTSRRGSSDHGALSEHSPVCVMHVLEREGS